MPSSVIQTYDDRYETLQSAAKFFFYATRTDLDFKRARNDLAATEDVRKVCTQIPDCGMTFGAASIFILAYWNEPPNFQEQRRAGFHVARSITHLNGRLPMPASLKHGYV